MATFSTRMTSSAPASANPRIPAAISVGEPRSGGASSTNQTSSGVGPISVYTQTDRSIVSG